MQGNALCVKYMIQFRWQQRHKREHGKEALGLHPWQEGGYYSYQQNAICPEFDISIFAEEHNN